MGYILSKIGGEDSEQFREMMNKMSSLQNGNVEEYVKQVSEFYSNLLFEEKLNKTLLSKQLRLNSFIDCLKDFRSKLKAIKKHLSMKCISKNGVIKYTTNPLFKEDEV